MEKAKRENVCSANLLVEKHRKAIQSKQEISANSVVLGYAKWFTVNSPTDQLADSNSPTYKIE